MGMDRAFFTPTVSLDQSRYEELIRAEQKAEQYREELKRLGEYDYLINIIETTSIETTPVEKPIEIEGGNEDGGSKK